MMNSEMTFFEHLSELRSRVLVVFFTMIFFSLMGYYYSENIIEILLKSSKSDISDFQVIYITTMFMIKINIAIFSGIVCSFPILFYNILMFLKPAFKSSLSFTKVLSFVIFSIFLFFIGILFGYFILIPTSVNFFNSISFNLLGSVSLNYTLENYLIYLCWILLISSTIYQVPILLLLLAKIGILNTRTLKNKRSYVVIGFFILAAFLTPPDPFSQLLVALPMIILYEITILIIKIFFKND